jgi:hypothetical protein
VASELQVGTSVVGYQVLGILNRPYPYIEIYSGFADNLPRLRFQGHILLCYTYKFGDFDILTTLRSLSHFSHPSAFLLTPQELALERIAIAANWQNPGYEWNVFSTDFPYP